MERAAEMERKSREQGYLLAGYYPNCTHLAFWDVNKWGNNRWFECALGSHVSGSTYKVIAGYNNGQGEKS